jgi:hypothetical protein
MIIRFFRKYFRGKVYPIAKLFFCRSCKKKLQKDGFDITPKKNLISNKELPNEI